jgi:prepilin-type N-terminal cleavage/methylation domain-containing protein
MSSSNKKAESGFSLIELLIAMAVSITLMTVATSLLATALRSRTRENQKSDALADTQRALNIMSREIANAGFNMTNNGIVAADSSRTGIRIRANLNRYIYDDPNVTEAMRQTSTDGEEDITYFINTADNTKYLARHDEYGTGSTVLANRIDSLNIYYFAEKVTYQCLPGGFDITDKSEDEVLSKADAKYIVIAVSVTLDAVGAPGSRGYQPPYSVLLCSDVTLRNNNLWNY